MSISDFFASRNPKAKASQQLFTLTDYVNPQKRILSQEPQSISKKKQNIQTDILHKSNKKIKKKNNEAKSINQKSQADEDLQSTIFVGNIPLNTSSKQLLKVFGDYGKISKIWFRSIPVEINKMGKKASHILKKYQEGADSMNAYIKFQKKSNAEAACQLNGTLFGQLTIRVTLCMQKVEDFETTVFIGNLPHKIKEEELRMHFQPVGTILNVRLIKNPNTFEGIGIGYVRYSSKEEMRSAITQLNGTNLQDRIIRVKKAVPKERLQKKERMIEMKKKRKQLQPTNQKHLNIINKKWKQSRQINKSKTSQEKPQSREQIWTQSRQKIQKSSATPLNHLAREKTRKSPIRLRAQKNKKVSQKKNQSPIYSRNRPLPSQFKPKKVELESLGKTGKPGNMWKKTKKIKK